MLSFSISTLVLAEGDHSDHDHGKEKKKEDHSDHKKGDDHGHEKKGHDDHKGHKDEDGHAHGKSKKDDHSDHGDGGKAIGEGKAIVAVDEVKGLKLSKETIRTLKIKLKTVEGATFKITKETLVTSKSKKGVYRFRGGYFKFLEAVILKEEKSGYKVKVKGVEFGDQIVINGVGLLRVTDVFSTDESEYGHSH